MKNKYSFLFLTLFLVGSIQAQEYKVLKVIGGIDYKSSGDPMQTGDQYNEKQELKYKSNQSKAFLFHPSAGRKVLAEQNGTMGLTPAMANVSSRAGALVNALDVQKYFSGNVLVLGKSEVEIPEGVYPQDEGHFFHLEYAYSEETIQKKLPAEGNKLILDAQAIFMIDGTKMAIPESSPVKLWYRDASKGESVLISEFVLVTPSEDQTKEEIDLLLADRTSTDDAFTNDAMAYLTEAYGKIEKSTLQAWLSQQYAQ